MIELQPHLAKLHRASENWGNRTPYAGLDRNERVSPLTHGEFRKILKSLTPDLLCHYPDTGPFYQQLSKTLKLPPSFLYATPGSDAAIRMAFHAFVRPDDRVLFPYPSYAMYDVYGQMFRARVQKLPYDQYFEFNIDELWRQLRQQPRLLAIANPDQPTGSVLSERRLGDIIRFASHQNTLVLIDEAYYPFYPKTIVSLVKAFENLIVTRSFSKSGGLAGLRLGYLVAQPRLIEMLTQVRGAFEVNSIALAVGTYLLKHPQVMEEHVKAVEAGRRILLTAAEKLGIDSPACPTNFQLLRFPGMHKTDLLVTLLKQRKFLVKGSFSMPGLQNAIRVTLDGPPLMRAFVRALQSSLRTLQWKSR